MAKAYVHLKLPSGMTTLVRLASVMTDLRGKVLLYDSGFTGGRTAPARVLVELPPSRVAKLEEVMGCEALDHKGERWTNAEGAPG